MFDRKTNLWILAWSSVLAAALLGECVAARVFILMAIIAVGAIFYPQVSENG